MQNSCEARAITCYRNMSYDLVGSVMIESERNKGAHIPRQIPVETAKASTCHLSPSAPSSSPSTSSSAKDYRVVAERSEPDWSNFEAIYAKDLLPFREEVQSHATEDEKNPKSCQTPANQSAALTETHRRTSGFLFEIVAILLDYLRKCNDRSTKVLDFHHPHTLKEMMSHCLDITDEPQNLEQILSDCKETLKYCVKTGHPRFFNQLSTGLDVIALAGEWLTATANTNMFTYEIAPVFTLIEDIVLTKMRKHVGWPNGDGDGIFAPGGAISNLYAVAVARHKFLPESKRQGMTGNKRLVMFTSDQSHFSIIRAAALLGIGTDNVILVKSDERGKLIASDLAQKVERSKSEGATPFFVSATSGTTVLGAFDPLNEIADVCDRHRLWLHVDAAWGGGLLLSKKHKGLLNGIHRANSVTWNPHKLMGSLLQCSAILISEKGLLEACNASNAAYLFQQDKHYDVTYDTGDKAIQCGRHNDVFKLWLVWRAKGETGLQDQIDRLMELAKYLLERVSEREGFQLILPNPEFLNVCFWYIPKNLRCLPEGSERDKMLDKVAPKIKAMMMERGMTMIGYQPLGTRPNFFRAIISNPATTTSDIDFLISEIERLGEEI